MTDVNTGRGGSRVGAGRKPIPCKTHRLNLADSAEPTKAPQKECDYLIHLREKSNHYQQMVIRSFCGSWACPLCNRSNKWKWINQITSRTIINVDEERHWSSQASIMSVKTDKEWDCVRKRLQRKNADFARVRLNDGQLAVINVGGFGDLYTGDSFESELKKIFDAVGYGHKPVSTSKTWQMGTQESTHKWERVSRLQINLPALNEALSEFDIHTEPILSVHLSGLTFKCPPDWTEQEIESFSYDLASRPGEESE